MTSFSYDIVLAQKIGVQEAIIVNAIKMLYSLNIVPTTNKIAAITGMKENTVPLIITKMKEKKILSDEGGKLVVVLNLDNEPVKPKYYSYINDINVRTYAKALNLSEEDLEKLCIYRSNIGKPIMSKAGLMGLLKDIHHTQIQTGKDISELLEIMIMNEWKTIKPKYIEDNENNKEGGNIKWI